MSIELHVSPGPPEWLDRAEACPVGDLLGRSRNEWRELTRAELGLDGRRRIIATGHQTLLWHPGILVKYLLTDAIAARHDVGTANLIVDQHAGGFGTYDVPVRLRDGALGVRAIELAQPRPGVPMLLHAPAAPPEPPRDLAAALPCVAEGVRGIHEAVVRHRDAPDAAHQMARALADLMARWVRPMAPVPSSALLGTSLGRALLHEMARDPDRCVGAYNDAVAAVPDAGIAPLPGGGDSLELPLWRLDEAGRRVHASARDVSAALAAESGGPRLLPRALMLTALVRLGMCDLFVHGTGGGNYDRAMERWLWAWLGAAPSPAVVASATLRLPLRPEGWTPADPARRAAEARRLWHDPEPTEGDVGPPGPIKSELLAAVSGAPRGSAARQEAFFAMHREIKVLRGVHAGRVEPAQRRALEARRALRDAAIADRRDWPFPLYPPEMIEDLAAAVARTVEGSLVAGQLDY